MEQGELSWLIKLQGFINGLLTPIIPLDIERYQYLGQEQMAIWALAFTSETYDTLYNYEELEYRGDAALKYVFPRYLMDRYPNFTRRDYTELNVAYMSKIPQAELARKLNLNSYVRTRGLDRVDLVNIQGDIFESFFGALDVISDRVQDMIVNRQQIRKFGSLGISNCYNMIAYLFNPVTIDLEKRFGPPKTKTAQIFSRFGLSKPVGVLEGDRFLIYLQLDGVDFLKNYGVVFEGTKIVPIPDGDKSSEKGRKGIIIGSGSGSTKKEAEANAYINAYNTLSSKGITPQWAERAKQVKDFSEPEVAPYVNAAEERYKREGFVSMYFATPNKTTTKTGAVVQLIGSRADGSKEVLMTEYSTDQEGRHRTAKGLLVQKYAEK